MGTNLAVLAAVEAGDQPVRPEELVRLAKLYRCKLSALLRSMEWAESRTAQDPEAVRQGRPTDSKIRSPRERDWAVHAWRRGELSEAELASYLRVDRLSARKIALALKS